MNRILLLLFVVVLAQNPAMAQHPSIEYSLSMSKPSTHFFEVEVSVTGLPTTFQHLDFVLPVWRSGRYKILDFAGGVDHFSATDAGNQPVQWEKTDKTTWRVTTAGLQRVVVRYQVYANEFAERTRGLNDEHAFVDPAAVCMYPEHFQHLPLGITVHPFGSWHVTTGLSPDPRQEHRYTAPDYETFADCPLVIGNQHDFPFEADGKRHILCIDGEGNWNADTLIRDITRLIKANKEYWGELPYNEYIFFLLLSSQGGGGTEHLNSAVMETNPLAFKNPSSYLGVIGLISHEYVHTWNVKQLRPRGLRPYNWTRENYTKELWIAEGSTSYVSGLIKTRAGFNTAKSYLDGIPGTVQADRQRPGNKVQSINESSFDAWVKFWQGTEDSYNTETDYYGKGANVSMLLDLEIRHRSNNRHSFDDLMRTMYRRFPLNGPGYTVADFQRVAEELAGGSLEKFFNDYVSGVQPIDWERYLGYAGLLLTPKAAPPTPWLGIATPEVGDRTVINRIVEGSPAYEAGLNIRDEIVALDGRRLRPSEVRTRIADLTVGDSVTITVFRGDRLRDFKVMVQAQPVPSYQVTQVETPTSLQRSIYEGWLGTKWKE